VPQKIRLSTGAARWQPLKLPILVGKKSWQKKLAKKVADPKLQQLFAPARSVPGRRGARIVPTCQALICGQQIKVGNKSCGLGSD
jgi:hypothetical protein